MGLKITVERVDNNAVAPNNFRAVAGTGNYPGDLPIQIIVSETNVTLNTVKSLLAMMAQSKMTSTITAYGASLNAVVASGHNEHVT